jgi:hypothetical protein
MREYSRILTEEKVTWRRCVGLITVDVGWMVLEVVVVEPLSVIDEVLSVPVKEASLDPPFPKSTGKDNVLLIIGFRNLAIPCDFGGERERRRPVGGGESDLTSGVAASCGDSLSLGKEVVVGGEVVVDVPRLRLRPRRKN